VSVAWSPVPYHVVIRLPGGRVACADYRDPVARPMHKINDAIARGRPPAPALYAEVAAWLDGHAAQSAACHAGLSPRGRPCGHDLGSLALARARLTPGHGNAPDAPGNAADPGGHARRWTTALDPRFTRPGSKQPRGGDQP
jgi:hypothetical protein